MTLFDNSVVAAVVGVGPLFVYTVVLWVRGVRSGGRA